MDDMREIVTKEQIDHLFLLLALLGPLVGLLIGALLGARRGRAGRGALNGLAIGMFGVLNLLTWKGYNVLTDHLGLDSVKNLLINLALFVGLGLLAGWIFTRYFPSSRGSSREDDGTDRVGASISGPPSSRSPGSSRSVVEADIPPRSP